jgi:hypothetical protein
VNQQPNIVPNYGGNRNERPPAGGYQQQPSGNWNERPPAGGYQQQPSGNWNERPVAV